MHRRLAWGLFMMLGCAGATSAPQDTHLEVARIAVCDAKSPDGVRATFRGGLWLTWPGWSGFGGWSDVRVTPNGQELLAVSDSGHFLQLHLTHEEGRLAAARGMASGALPHCPDKRTCDVESMAQQADGSWWLGVERQIGSGDQIWAFAQTQPPFQSASGTIALPAGLEAMPKNAGLEAMTTLADNSVLAIAEGPEPVPATLPMWRWQVGVWHALRYPTVADFRPVAAAALPSGHPLGDALVLERKWLAATQEAGTRVVALRLPTGGGAPVGREVLQLDPKRCLLDNFEGLATRVEGAQVWLYLLSDDNESARQKTLLYAFTLD